MEYILDPEGSPDGKVLKGTTVKVAEYKTVNANGRSICSKVGKISSSKVYFFVTHLASVRASKSELKESR